MGKLQEKLLIISLLLILPFSSHAQNKIDTTNLKKDIEAVFKKYGINETGYLINVTSNNQSGGQTAFIITNNYYKDLTPDSTNYHMRLIKEQGVPYLEVYPKKGIWASPFFAKGDSIKRPPEGYMTIYATFTRVNFDSNLGGYPHFTGFYRSTSCSESNPLFIELKETINEMTLFGDYNELNKTYLYYKGKVYWRPRNPTQ